jgi:hypothetical protein
MYPECPSSENYRHSNQVQFDRLRSTLDEILNELRSIERADGVDDETLTPIRTTVEIIGGFE